jgi:hypothetical protein
MSKRKSRDRVLSWRSAAMLILPSERSDGRRLAVLVDCEHLSVTALETDADGARSVEAAFHNHAHKLLGDAENLPHAIAMAERYAQEWLAQTQTPKACECGEIQPMAVS